MKVWIFTNPTIDLLLQSIYWLLLISLIPKKSSRNKSYSFYYFFPVLLIFYFHLYSEENIIGSFLQNMTINFLALNIVESYILEIIIYTHILLNIFLIIFIFNKLITGRFENLINYLPFIFFSLWYLQFIKFKFYLIAFTFLGVVSIFEKKINVKFTIIY